jgi:uncharacterized protein YfaQ (DUF2300 family)
MTSALVPTPGHRTRLYTWVVWRWVLSACVALLAGFSTCAGAANTQAPEPAAGELQLAWQSRNGQIHTVVLDARGQPLARPVAPILADHSVPLGSLWKLVAYARLADDTSTARESDYVCRGRLKDEVYCCNSGERIDRGTALWRSCGLYFEPSRVRWSQRPLGLTLDALPQPLHGLRVAEQLHSRHTVPLADWLNWLAQWPQETQQSARDDLLPYWLQGPGRSQLASVGSRMRVKTFTLERQGSSQERWAGASGWLSDGRPIWMAARGTSMQVLPDWAPLALRHLDLNDGRLTVATHPQAPCVDVHYLQRYPIDQILDARGQVVPTNSQAGALLRGGYRLQLRNGNQVDIASDQDLRWQQGVDGAPQLYARLTLDEYVARVIDREGSAQPKAAARALALAARTYVLNLGMPQGGCLQIDDSSHRQRVAPRPATLASRQISEDVADLVLMGGIGQYHHDQASPGVMAWTHAVSQAQSGWGFDAILRQAYPRASLASLTGRQGRQCEPLPLAQAWLDRQVPRWRSNLQGLAGYTPPGQSQVCRLLLGMPHAQQASRRIYVRGVQSMDERLTLAHEYLHLAFAGHPRGHQEAFVEGMARKLLGVD